ncbi:mitochondrial carrier [Malassezia pachydermatis]|uniref:Mitochondrial carrier n=1 Tax=Malassezia pachydermatis TaxID=77020 RepID=A0A0M9VN49_9BASI|nr:mitochondrial carrier [Malassezia pachydermatis]KOS12949.1 mitochondrial carrier [Malassezia pachydermatis]
MDPPPQPRAERYLSYEEFREQEPPQARLLRLRGLFELLVDQDSSSALAGGRAKQMWRARASRARYGAGGALATGSLVDQKEPVHAAKAAHQREWLALVRRNRYASELLAECRKRHAELEKQQREAQGHGDQHSLQDTLWSKWHSVVSLVHEELSVEDKPSIWASIQNLLSSDMPSMLMSRESGWTGSRVWGLQARENGSHGHDTPTPTCTATSSNDKERARQRQIEWEGFVAYAEFQERALYSLFGEIDTNKDGMLDEEDIQAAFDKAGIRMTHVVLDDFIASIASSGVQDVKELHARDLYVTFPEFRDYLLLLPRKPTVPEIFRFYQVRKAVGLFGTEGIFAELGAAMGKTARGVTHVNFDGDMTYSGELDRDEKKQGKETDGCVEEEEASTKDNEPSEDAKPKSDMIQFDVAAKFLLAGGLAGAVSRTATAPFDRLKIFLMTSRASLSPAAMGQGATTTKSGFGALAQGMITIYQEGGLRGFWLGNGLNCMKIIPESAIKFFTYEYMKRFFAKYVDGVSDSRDISGMSRFVSGGVGGITSQLSIYPIETLKTRLMSSMNNQGHVRGMALLCQTAREMWQRGRFRAYYRGLGAGLLGVFPYSAIDMSTFEGTKLFYLRYTGKDEPGVLALLAFGSFSGSVGAATVYPLNLVRTRLQASGTPAHPFIYKSLWDATYQTFQREGILGFYRGLIPTLAKVVPAVSISYVVYDRAKKTLGVA